MAERSGCYIIAEAGCEHTGSIKRAIELIDVATYAGADCVKFQLFYPEEVGAKVWNKIKKFHIGYTDMIKLSAYAETKDIDFLCSAFGLRSLHALSGLCKSIKVPAPCNEWDEYLQLAHELFKKVIVSSGMTHKGLWPGDTVLQCTSAYHCPYDQVNLNTLHKYDGLSDHTLGIHIPVAAVALGARIIEKHFTLVEPGDPISQGGPDAGMALSPSQLDDMVEQIRQIEQAMGDGVKRVEESEKELLWRKTL